MADHPRGIEQFEAGLWQIADDLRADFGLASNGYFLLLMGLLATVLAVLPKPAAQRALRRSGGPRCSR